MGTSRSPREGTRLLRLSCAPAQSITAGSGSLCRSRLCAVCRRVQNLFHSVSLNVNNPHFLIMQGRITKARTLCPPAARSPTVCGLRRLWQAKGMRWDAAAESTQCRH